MTFFSILCSLCHIPVILKVNQRELKSTLNRNFLDGSQRVLFRTTQPPRHPPTKCMESHKHKDACFSSSWLNKKQKRGAERLPAFFVLGFCLNLCPALGAGDNDFSLAHRNTADGLAGHGASGGQGR